MPTLDVSELNIVVSVLGAFTVLYGLVAVKIKGVWYLGEALPAVLIGMLLGPISAKFLDAKRWGSAAPDQQDAITLGVMRVMIGIQLVIAGYQLPAKYILTRYKELIVCLIPIMATMWLMSSVCILATIPKISLLAALVIGACVTSTDPILSQAVAKGPFADKYVARPLREMISAEAGANDGFASPFLMLAVNLLRLTENRRATLVERGRGVGPDTQDVGIALGNWVIETLIYIVMLAIAYGTVTGYFARVGVKFSLSRRWIDSESYLLFPTALGLFIVGTCGAIGTSDLLACFVAGCALNWDGEFLAETERRHDEVNSCIDVLLNFGGFLYIGTTIPWSDFHQPDTTGITVPRLLALGLLVLVFRRIPALLLTYKMMPGVVKNWKEAVFMGYFGPIGVGAIYYLEHTKELFPKEQVASAKERDLLDAMTPVVYFIVLFSIIVHGLSIPLLSTIYSYCNVRTITEDAVEVKRKSIYMATPPNAFRGDSDTWICFNRFSRPMANLATLPTTNNNNNHRRPHSSDGESVMSDIEEEKKHSQMEYIERVEPK
ncbi:Sodium/hydrogen exchanger family-domain-containing protein [Hypoxylon fragiforme]|uniref:Sodium/hydrogen exchanger family-domain-containing protein n=1 Tax=Hypoxylon fragiforme TaxID=63214 RepID=UPI0020C6458D|nr:Sodium/hydrogen exchanger family-domain-containing protein [Hypoxylon fragiforme]KAI2602917.1 Sodium/hydrogen exchanger family-domain-containing protein [Hypoxylon fragiforme]